MDSLILNQEKHNDSFESIVVKKQVEQFKNKYLSLWWETRTDFPKFQKKVSLENKFNNERYLKKFKQELKKELHKIPRDRNEKNKFSGRIFALIRDLEQKIVGYENSYIDFFLKKGYQNVTEMFIYEVARFDSQMKVYDIFQAIRNVWIMNSLQIIFNLKVKLTSSIFSYSMLYPYSDNYLDNPNISANNKIDFNRKFRKWLEGVEDEASNHNEKCILQLVNKIENEFSRITYPEVFESLLSIHTAQEKSLFQQKEKSLPYERDIIGITFEKGGTSVLADGYLVKGRLSQKEAEFLFGYGVFLQMIDDLQDVKEDYKNSHMTIFSQTVYKWPLNKLVNKLLWFLEEILNQLDNFLTHDLIKFKTVIHECCIIMIFEAIAKNKSLFSKQYIKDIEEYSLLKFSYFRKLKKDFSRDFSSEDFHVLCNIISKNDELI